MKEHHNVSGDDVVASAVVVVSAAVDWRSLADQRLGRLVELEHDYSIMRDRLALLQHDYRESLVTNMGQQQRIRELDDRLEDLAKKCISMRTEYESAQAARDMARDFSVETCMIVLAQRFHLIDRELDGVPDGGVQHGGCHGVA